MTSQLLPPMLTTRPVLSVGKPVPVKVTRVPPSRDPEVGKTLVTDRSYVMSEMLLVLQMWIGNIGIWYACACSIGIASAYFLHENIRPMELSAKS